MVTKKRSGRKAAPRRRTNKSGIPMIPAAAATAALVAVNIGKVGNLYKAINNNGKQATLDLMLKRTKQGLTGQNNWVNKSMKAFISTDALVTDALAVAGGYVGGEIVKKYAPGVIKRPLGKIAKKIPKVI